MSEDGLYCDSCGDKIQNGYMVNYTDGTFYYCEDDGNYILPPEVKKVAIPIVNGTPYSSLVGFWDSFDESKFKHYKLSD